MYIKRALEGTILTTTKNYPVIIVTGPRQVGKTTMLKNIANKERKYVTLDDPMERALAKSDPLTFLARHTPPVIIDEIQYATELLPYIKMYVDEHKNMGDYWLTGSQMFHMMKGVSESLAGRACIINMLGFSNSELERVESTPYSTDYEILKSKLETNRKQDLKEVYNHIFTGSMPALYERKLDKEQFFASYVDTYLQRDIKDLSQVANTMTFLKFLTAVAARTGQMLNYADIAKDIEISAPTAKQWMSILVSSGIVYLIEPYYNNILKRAVKSPMIYFLDTGLCSYLTKWNSSESLEVGAMAGAFFESYVVSEIIKSFYNAGRRPPIYYYRDIDKKEIDLLIEQNGTLYPIEIKKSANPNKDSIKHFSVLNKTKKPVGTGNVICMYHNLLHIDKNNLYVPVWLV
jgi:predicted AAA+ superfamily ATPase